MDRRIIAPQFRDRLHMVITRLDLPQARFSQAIGIDRSTLAQLLSPDHDRLPRAETLIAIAQLANVTVDWLLGLSTRETNAPEMMEQQFSMEGQARSPFDNKFTVWAEEAAGYKIRTVPQTFPDLLKTVDVIRFEYELTQGVEVDTKLANAVARLDFLRRPETEIEACVPMQEIETLAAGKGRWQGLAAAQRRDQIANMAQLCRDLYPSFRLYLYDVRRISSSPFTVIGPLRASVFLGDMYLVFTSSAHVRVFARRFDDLIRAAAVQPTEIASFLDTLPISGD